MELEALIQLSGTIFLVSLGVSLLELLYLTVISRQESFTHAYGQPLKNAVFVGLLELLLPTFSTLAFAVLGSQLALLNLGNDWYIWPLALLIFEFWYWLQHWLGHKVRLLWCIHSPHHAPDTLTSLIGLGRHILELPYLGFFLGFMTALCGVPVEMVVVISMIDGVWGKFLHISPKMVPWRYGPLEYVLQTPRWHRVHHAKNVLYMDTNYTSITLFWDWLLGTLQPMNDTVAVDYGITREVNPESWWDVQFGEFRSLWMDLRRAPDWPSRFGYLFMPPGWSHTGEHKTVALQKASLPPPGG
ncbi:MAG: sterol desaturase family protein [Pseudomonadota bacterium]